MFVIVFYKTPISVVVDVFLGIFSKSFAITPLSVAAHCTRPGSIRRQKIHQIFVVPLQNGLLQRNYRHTAFALAVCAKAKFRDVGVMPEVIVKSRAKSACAHSVNNPHL